MDTLIANILGSEQFSGLLLLVATSVATAVAGAVGMQVRRLLGTRVSKEQHELLERVAGTVVLAVEQTGLGAESRDKKRQAVSYVDDLMRKYGVKATGPQLEAAIEGAVVKELGLSAPMSQVPSIPTDLPEELP